MTWEMLGWALWIGAAVIYGVAEARAESDPVFARWWRGDRR